MALEEWCFAELERSRPVEELIQQILYGNECIAILGIASMLALHTQMVSEITLPLFTSQRLLDADYRRMAQDLSSTVNLIGFTSRVDESHIKAVQAMNARPVRKTQLRQMVPRFIFATEPIAIRARKAILNFKNALPYEYEEHLNIPEIREHLTDQALEYAALANPENYQAYRTKENSEQIVIVHVSPSAAEPENIARVEEASRYLRLSDLWAWADGSFKEKAIQNTYTIEDALALAREATSGDLFMFSNDENETEDLPMRRQAVAAVAAIVLNFREGQIQENLKWARDTLRQAIRLPENFDLMWSSTSFMPWHHAIYGAKGLAADLREGITEGSAARDLLGLIGHPLEVVSLAALEEACKLWPQDPRLTWAAMYLAFSLCHVSPAQGDRFRQRNEPLYSPSEAQAVVDTAIAFYENGDGWFSLPLPPPAWVKVKPGKGRRGLQSYEEYDGDDAADTAEMWGESDVFWHSEQAAKILKCIPIDEVLSSSAKSALLDFLAAALNWTNEKKAPPWVRPGQRDHSVANLFEWTRGLGLGLGKVAGLIPLNEFQVRFLEPILRLEGNHCWALLSPFATAYICNYLYDAPVVPIDAVTTLDLCLEKFLQDSVFQRNRYRSGEFSGFDQPDLVRTLMFVSVERVDLAARYVNGDWSEIDHILPLIDRFVRAGGWAASVMNSFLTLCERARANYPAEAFADQVLTIISDGPDNLNGWHDTFIPARIAELVQHFAHLDEPMALPLAQKFLRILDIMVDMGDRRSAALQRSESFREIIVPGADSEIIK